MNKTLSILIVEDSEDDTLLLLRELRRGGFEPQYERVDTPGAMTNSLERQNWDLVVADFSMPRFNALAALETLKKHSPETPFIIVSGTIGEELAVAAMKNGAQDYIMKGNLTRLVPAIDRELQEAEERKERKRAAEELQRSQEQFRVAHDIQQRLFPKAAPQVRPFDIAGASFPAEATGGDYFDYLPMADGCLGLVVADVTGHGVGPALLMAETRACLRTVAANATDVGEIVTRVNQVLAEDVDFERYVTLIFAKLDPVTRTLIYVSAGHPTCYVIESSGRIRALLKRTGLPLGIPPKARYQPAASVQLQAGDTVLLLTDGGEEAVSPNEEVFGVERILEVARLHSAENATRIVEALYEAVHGFSHGRPQADDLTFVVAKVQETRSGDTPTVATSPAARSSKSPKQ